jgi:hypothetical protein
MPDIANDTLSYKLRYYRFKAVPADFIAKIKHRDR